MTNTLLNYTVLFVEDDEDVNIKVSSRLKRYFENVYTAKDGEQGWTLYLQYKPQILFLDINLPKLSGIELLKRIRKNDHNTKAVMLTAYSDVDFLLETNELKLTKYIVKPLDREILDNTIKMLVNEMNSFKTVSLKNIVLKDGMQWSFEKKELFKDGSIVSLTPYEKKVFECFAKNTNITLSFDDIILLVWDSFESDKKETLKTIIKTLRKKLPKDTIANIFGIGYQMSL